ncbi:hypothetical protein AAVH_42597 [Aphelenchoides avenae]|nr:hypothetical protein AAVH_42597 [Aphelenchus avenae]
MWLDDKWIVEGYRFSRSLGANDIVVDGNAVYPEGNVSRKGADAPVKFIKSLSSWLIVEATGQGPAPSSSSSITQPVGYLHQDRAGKIEKKSKPARDVPSRGGGGGGQTRGNYRGYNKSKKH